jgi:Sodium:solute symporter family
MIANVMTNEVGGVKELLNRLPAEKLQVAGHAKIGYYTSLALFLGVWSPFLLSPPFVARMLMARDKKQATHMLFMGGVFLLFFFFLIMLIGLAAFVLYPTIAPDKVIPHVVNELFPVGLRGVCAAGIIAVIMSTADSFLHAAGLSLIHDVIRPLSTAKIQELRWVKYCTFAVGCVSMLVTLRTFSIFGMAIYGMGMMGATITMPFVAGVLGLKTAPQSFKVALWITIPTFIVTNLLFGAEIHHWAYPISFMVNVIVFFGMHVLQHKGFMVETHMGNKKLLWRPTWSGLTEWLPTPRKLLAYSHQKVYQYGTDSILFALFLSLNYMVPFFMYSYSNPAIYGWVLAVKSISIFLCLGLFLKPYWPPKLLEYFPVYYHLTLLYCLPFVTTFLFLLEERNIEWVVNIVLSIMFLIVLVDWTTFLGLSMLGVLLAIGLYKLGIDAVSIHMDLDTRYTLTYAITFSTLIGLLFSRRREQHLEAKLREISEHYYINNHATTEAHPATIRIATMIDHKVQETLARYSLSVADTDQAQQTDPFHTATDCLLYFFPTALAVIQQGHQMTQQLIEEIKANYIAPQGSLLSIRACLTAILEAYGKRHPQDTQVDLKEDYRIYTSFNHLQYVIIHVLSFLHAHHLGDKVCLWTRRQQGIHVRLPGQALSPSLLHELCTLFPPKAMAKHPGLAISRLLIEAQGGRLLYATSSLPQNSYTEFIISLPAAEEPLSTGLDMV